MSGALDAIVIGGGLVGASVAAALERAALDVALVEPQAPGPAPDANVWDTRIYTLSPGNAAWLGALGVWAALPQDRLTRVETMRIYGGRAGAELRFDAYEAGVRELAWTVENGELQRALWNALKNRPRMAIYTSRCVDIAWGAEHAQLTLDGGRTLDGGTTLEGRLIVGADGADSWVRERAGIGAERHPYGQLGVVANLETERPHEQTAYQWFRGDGVLAVLPLPGRRISIVWSTPEAHARELVAASRTDFENRVVEASGGVLGAVRMITAPAAFPLQRMRAERLVEPRVALAGDAAHVIHPLAGQGMNVGIRDARELVEVIAARGVRQDCGDYALLRRYERARREEILAFELATDGLQKLFASPAVWLAGARDSGLALVNTQPALKNFLIRRAMA